MKLTPLGPHWGWGHRAIEIVAWTLSTLILGPFVLLYRGLEWVMEKVWTS